MLELEARLITAEQEVQRRAAAAREQAQMSQVGGGLPVRPALRSDVANELEQWFSHSLG